MSREEKLRLSARNAPPRRSCLKEHNSKTRDSIHFKASEYSVHTKVMKAVSSVPTIGFSEHTWRAKSHSNSVNMKSSDRPI